MSARYRWSWFLFAVLLTGILLWTHRREYRACDTDGCVAIDRWSGRVEFTHQLYAEPSISWNWVTVPTGEANTDVVSTRVTYTITPRMFTSALLQYQSRSHAFTTNARLRWEYRPGSELFVVYSDGRNTLEPGFPQLDNRSFVLKITRLFRW